MHGQRRKLFHVHLTCPTSEGGRKIISVKKKNNLRKGSMRKMSNVNSFLLNPAHEYSNNRSRYPSKQVHRINITTNTTVRKVF